MHLQYICRSCNQYLGMIDPKEVTDRQLGFDRLTPDERKDIITSDAHGNTFVRVTCEVCQDVLEKQSNSHVEGNYIH
ncbi:DUF2757 family protein [Hazenella sp. IB182357]|uniref:DUF2757 family protein n=1 Tax=Polycladospora coralii TaxID=2771432 RepID=A0A926NAG6_9BACL|nr:anti-sigma-F factor Fin [Polycladospora coralii]MBD1372462.1 DUF2757 family protein [Polycladospora coralii]MBS7531784.1 DUF2757 family protein [Polycladospora coralii]